MKEQIRWIFRLYDINGDGLLHIHEILEILRSANLENEYTETVTELFQRMDTNNDGVLTMDEFINQSMDDFTFVKVLGKAKTEKRVSTSTGTSPNGRTRNNSKTEMSPTGRTRNGRTPSRSENSPGRTRRDKLSTSKKVSNHGTIKNERESVTTYY